MPRDRITVRWEGGVPHDERSIKIYKKIAELDLKECGDSMGFKSGGDGDNGETLMYLLDLMFEDQDAEERKGKMRHDEIADDIAKLKELREDVHRMVKELPQNKMERVVSARENLRFAALYVAEALDDMKTLQREWRKKHPDSYERQIKQSDPL